MDSKLYKETFSKVKSSYEFDISDFEGRKRPKVGGALRRTAVIAAVAALLAAFTITASATGFFGMRPTEPEEADNGVIDTIEDYSAAPESQALAQWLVSDGSNASYDAIAQRHGLEVHEDFALLSPTEFMSDVGDFLAARNSIDVRFMHEDGSFYVDGAFRLDSFHKIQYRIVRAVRGAFTDFLPSVGDEKYSERQMSVGDRTLVLALGEARSLIIGDLGSSILAVDVHGGTDQGIEQWDLEALAGSIDLEVLADLKRPELPKEEYVDFGAGVTILEENVISEQSFSVSLNGWGKVMFISYAPTEEFEDVRFFISDDGAVSDFELSPIYTGLEFKDVAAVSFEDVSGDGYADIIVIVDYAPQAGEPYREARVYTARGEGVFLIDWELTKLVNSSVEMSEMDIYAIRRILAS